MILLVWAHLLAAVTWVGGMAFLTLVLVPTLRDPAFAAQRAVLFRSVALRFRVIVWVTLVILVATGPVLLSLRGEHLLDPGSWSLLVAIKLGLVAVLLGLTGLHDFWLGPLVSQLMRAGSETWTAQGRLLVRLAPWVARAGLVLALGVLLAGVSLVRS